MKNKKILVEIILVVAIVACNKDTNITNADKKDTERNMNIDVEVKSENKQNIEKESVVSNNAKDVVVSEVGMYKSGQQQLIFEEKNNESFCIGIIENGYYFNIVETDDANWIKIETPTGIIGWTVNNGKIVIAENIKIDNTFKREVEDYVDIDLKELNKLSMNSDIGKDDSVLGDIKEKKFLDLLLNERELLNISSGIWQRKTIEEIHSFFKEAIIDRNRLVAIFPPTITGGLYPGNPEIWFFTNLEVADFLTSNIELDYSISDLYINNDHGRFYLILDENSGSEYRQIIFDIKKTNTSLFRQLNSKYEIVSIYFNAMQNDIDYEELSKGYQSNDSYRDAVLGSIDSYIYVSGL